MKVLQGTISQNSDVFSEQNRGSQCTAISAAACCAVLARGPTGWTCATVDEIVRVGDQLYEDSWTNVPESQRQNFLDPSELLRVAPFKRPLPFTVDLAGTITGQLKPFQNFEFDLPTLQQGLNEIFKQYRAAILVTCRYSVAVFNYDNQIYLYDSHSRNSHNGLPDPDGSAVFVHMTSLRELIKHVHTLYGRDGQYYELTGVSLNHLPQPILNLTSNSPPPAPTPMQEMHTLSMEEPEQNAPKVRRLTARDKANLKKEQQKKQKANRRKTDTDFQDKNTANTPERMAAKRKIDKNVIEAEAQRFRSKKKTKRKDVNSRQTEITQTTENLHHVEGSSRNERQLSTNVQPTLEQSQSNSSLQQNEAEPSTSCPRSTLDAEVAQSLECLHQEQIEVLSNIEISELSTSAQQTPEQQSQTNIILPQNEAECSAAKCAREKRAVEDSYEKQYKRKKMNYQKRIQEGPNSVCVSCGQLWFNKSVVVMSNQTLLKISPCSNWRQICKLWDSQINSGFLCKTCLKYLKKGKMPPLALVNGMEFPNIPEELKGLNPLEERILSPRIPFMQIRKLGVDSQYGLRGSCINVSVDVNTSVSLLPRLPENTHTVFVQIMRRMSDRHPYAFDSIRPGVVLKALRYLIETPMYQKHGIAVAEDVVQAFLQLSQNRTSIEVSPGDSRTLNLPQTNEPSLTNTHIESVTEENWDDLTEDEATRNLPTAETNQPPLTNGNIENATEENWDELTEEEAMLLEQETLLDDLIIADTGTGIRIAPGEGQIPMSLLFDEDIQELSFPTIYCGDIRPIRNKVSMTQIAKGEARMSDRRCALNAPHMFLTFSRLRRQKLAQAISTAIRKKRQRNVLTVSHVLNNETLGELVQHNDGYRVLQVDRSSPAYWEKKKKHILAMCRQKDVPPIFMSASCAESRWVQILVLLKFTVDKEKISTEDAKKLSWQEKVRLIQSDPYTIVRYFSRRMSELIKLLRSRGGPFKEHKMSHYVIRYEFQHRGSVHAHIIGWLDDAPKYSESDPESEQACIEFVDRFITCKEDESLGDLMNVQYHRHSRTCQRQMRSEQVCRFGVPWPPMRKTCILKPLDSSAFPEDDRKRLRAEYKTMKKVLISVFKTHEKITFDEFLQKLGWTEEKYLLTVRSTLRRPEMFLRRDVHEMKLNAYNKEILQLHDANMDIQFILDAYACVAYVVNYTTKSCGGVSKLLKETADKVRAGDVPLIQQLRTLSNVFVNKSEVSAQEAAFHILSLPLCITSDTDVYINTGPPEERTRMLKSMKDLEEIRANDPESEDILTAGLLQHYEQRPDELENCCLAEFAAWYNFSKKKSLTSSARDNDDNNDDNDDDFEEIDCRSEVNGCSNTFLTLKNHSGFVKRRSKPKIIRYRNYSLNHDPDNYKREHVMLFTAWRDENELIANSHSMFASAQETIEKNKRPYVKLGDDMNEILQVIMEEVELEEDCEGEARGPPAEFAIYELEAGQGDIGQDLPPDLINVNPRQLERFLLPRYQSSDEYFSNVARLNKRQRRYHLNLINHLKTNPNTPVQHFVSGGAGVGKSMLISVITQSSIRIFIEQQAVPPDALTVLLMAPTGKAAFNIGGVTLHSALHIFGQNEKINLNADELNTMRSQLLHLRLIIIDEISMVGRRMLLMINQRLQEIFDTREIFGGISIVTFGDFNQLSPVGDQWIFESGRDDLAVLAGSTLWNHFKFYELTEIMRQRDDARMAMALNRLAVGESTAEDDAMFKSREVTTLAMAGINPPEDAIELFETNAQANVHNTLYLNQLNTESFESSAMDYCEGEGTLDMKKKQLEKIQDWPLNKTQNLPRTLIAKLTARYMLTVNINTLDGLTNGACGTLRHIAWGRMANGKQIAIRLYIEFDEQSVGEKTRNDNYEVMQRDGVQRQKWTPIQRACRPIIPSKGSVFKIFRKQFPMVPAKGITIHKSQGSTFKSVVVHMRARNMNKRSVYVSFSRVTSVSGLFINGTYKRPSPPHISDLVLTEMLRLNSPENSLHYGILFPDLHEDLDDVTILFHNIRSLHKHHTHVLNDKSYTETDILIISESWTMPEDDINVPNFRVMHRTDCVKAKRHAYGMIVFVKETITPHVNILYQTVKNDFKGSKLHSFIHIVAVSIIKSQETIAVVALHKSPKCTVNILENELNMCLDDVLLRGITKIVILGDFNMNVQDAHTEARLSKIMASKGLTLAIDTEKCTTDSGTLIDLVYSNIPSVKANVLESVISDHKPIWFTLPFWNS